MIRSFPAIWRRMVDAWATPARAPRLWLMYSASYLARTGDVHWAIDPVRLHRRLPGAPVVDYAQGLSPLSFVLLTHRHGDHLDLGLMHSLRRLPITWVVPDAILLLVREQTGIPPRRIIVPEPSEKIELDGIRITPFDGMHWENTSENGLDRRGVPALGYLVESGSKRWLFPGDTRMYAADGLPAFGSVDTLFAHLWLGRSAALQDPPPLLDQFCRWCVDLCPRRVILTHLEEFGRSVEDYWDAAHAARVASRLSQFHSAMDVLPRIMGQSIRL